MIRPKRPSFLPFFSKEYTGNLIYPIFFSLIGWTGGTKKEVYRLRLGVWRLV